MSDPDQDEMRRKRLARLTGQPSPSAGGEKSKPAKVNTRDVLYNLNPSNADPNCSQIIFFVFFLGGGVGMQTWILFNTTYYK